MLIFRIIYNVIILILLPIAVPLGYLFALKKKEEKDYFERFGFIKIENIPKKSIWFHCASVGEAKSIKILVDRIREELKDISIVVSTVTYSGKKIAEKEINPDISFLLPLENSLAISYLVHLLNTKAFFIVDTELWPNLIYSVSKRCSLYLINGRISDKSFKGYYFFRFIFKNLLRRFEKIFVKSDEDFEKFSKIIGCDENLINLGNLKFFEKKDVDTSDLSFLEGKIITAGSTHRGEEELVLAAFESVGKYFEKLIIVPRHLNRVEEVVQIVRDKGYSPAKWSDGDLAVRDAKVVVVDVFGILEKLYKISEKIFIGGSVVENIGGHNIYEALQFEKVVAIGKNMWNFKEIYDLARKHNVVYVVEDKKQLIEYFRDDFMLPADFDGFERELKKSSEDKLDRILAEIKRWV
ncbi:3-deoxy-D-manno-octulosonic acid transferase [Deferribacter autotrophicus]|uniref:3-deoxy-D-manno-octulosonic acid transferase n=1 Tax=Deferribacter autotrophicus TaxID=500465 RepID=A0A5A8F3Z8_9BACT|nr:glycosyltransferase N-terminal domain-containing protein [Deferribacter autotrophicus]KAA0257763.1 3-deoxy-D-manno-octulosonic acid transferase [Deferribacter autotrophicus]